MAFSVGLAAGAQVVTEFPLPFGSFATAIVAGPDGALWFTDGGFGAESIGRVTIDGQLSHVPVPGNVSFGFQGWMTVGPDGAIWFTEDSGSEIGRITTAGDL